MFLLFYQNTLLWLILILSKMLEIHGITSGLEISVLLCFKRFHKVDHWTSVMFLTRRHTGHLVILDTSDPGSTTIRFESFSKFDGRQLCSPLGFDPQTPYYLYEKI